jgi:hypothetical protein
MKGALRCKSKGKGVSYKSYLALSTYDQGIRGVLNLIKAIAHIFQNR